MNIRIKPLDTLFFRDGKPFTMGEDNQADSIFPPPPSVLYGSLRTAYFAAHPDELGKADGPGDPTGSLKITALWMIVKNAKAEEACLPMPLDLAAQEKDLKEDKTDCPVTPLGQSQLGSGCSLSPLPQILSGDLNTVSIPRGALIISELNKYLAGDTGKLTARPLNRHIIKEPKVGIAKDRITGASSREGKIYQANMIRLDDLELAVSFTGLDLPAHGLLKLGGEARPASYDKADPPGIPAPNGDAKSFRLYLAAPAFFSNGWLPSWVDPATLTGSFGNLKLKITTAALGRAINIGGFDMKENKPKPMRRAVPEGSVYYFEILEGKFSDATEAFHGKSVSELDNSSAQGFGLSYVGAIK